MKKYFITGLVILAPIALTCIVVFYLFDLFTAPFAGLVENALEALSKGAQTGIFKHKELIFFASRLIALIAVLLLIILLGFVGRKFFFHSLIRLTNALFLRIPFVKTVFRITKDVTKAFFTQTDKAFKRTVVVPFPHEKTYAIGFVTGEIPGPIKRCIPDADLAVFVPTAPHPLSGFLLMTSKERSMDVDFTTEEAFKFLFSCGVAQPGEAVPENHNVHTSDART